MENVMRNFMMESYMFYGFDKLLYILQAQSPTDLISYKYVSLCLKPRDACISRCRACFYPTTFIRVLQLPLIVTDRGGGNIYYVFSG